MSIKIIKIILLRHIILKIHLIPPPFKIYIPSHSPSKKVQIRLNRHTILGEGVRIKYT